MDDVFVLWTGIEKQLDEFTAFLNTIHDLLEFSVTRDPKEICFLDVKVRKDGNKIHTSLYTKPTD